MLQLVDQVGGVADHADQEPDAKRAGREHQHLAPRHPTQLEQDRHFDIGFRGDGRAQRVEGLLDALRSLARLPRHEHRLDVGDGGRHRLLAEDRDRGVDRALVADNRGGGIQQRGHVAAQAGWWRGRRRRPQPDEHH